jgi:hypothetical protein
MTPRMLRALDEAFGGPETSGLQYTVAGYSAIGHVGTYHSFGTINALINRGYLSRRRVNGKRWACITQKGVEARRAAKKRGDA